MAYRINFNVEIRQCADVQKELGLFAAHRLTKGLKIMAEPPLVVSEQRTDLAADLPQQFPSLPEAGRAILIRMYAGRRDVNPFLPAGAVRDAHAIRPRRLETIAMLNSFEGIGIGCALSAGCAAINHE